MFDPCTWLVKKLFGQIATTKSHTLEVVFSDGTRLRNHGADERTDVSVRFRNKAAEWRTIVFFYDGFIEAYIEGDVDIDGEMGFAKLLTMAHATIARQVAVRRPINPIMWLRMLLQEARQNNRDIERAKRNAEFHYGFDP